MTEHEHATSKKINLKTEQEKTLKTPVLHANIFLKGMYLFADIVFGYQRTLPKFLVIEILARYPYWAWELGSYKRLTRTYARTGPVGKAEVETALRHIELGRKSQDNEQWHMFLIRDIMRQKGIRMGWLRGTLIPRFKALGYWLLVRTMYRLNPAWSFAMNARFESHAEHQYMLMVKEHPEWDNEPVETDYFQYYPKQKTLADLFRQIALDEREHMHESMEEYKRLTGRELVY